MQWEKYNDEAIEDFDKPTECVDVKQRITKKSAYVGGFAKPHKYLNKCLADINYSCLLKGKLRLIPPKQRVA